MQKIRLAFHQRGRLLQVAYKALLGYNLDPFWRQDRLYTHGNKKHLRSGDDMPGRQASQADTSSRDRKRQDWCLNVRSSAISCSRAAPAADACSSPAPSALLLLLIAIRSSPLRVVS